MTIEEIRNIMEMTGARRDVEAAYTLKRWENAAIILLAEVDRLTAALAEKENECKGLKNNNTELCYLMDAIIAVLDGKPVSDFAESFPIVRRLQDAIAGKEKDAEIATMSAHIKHLADLAASRLADQESIEQHTRRVVAKECLSIMEASETYEDAVEEIKERYEVE